MKVILSNLNENYLQEYTLKKSIQEGYIVEEIKSDLVFQTKTDFDYLLRAAANGEQKETGTVEFYCGNEQFEKDALIKHNEGTFDLRACRIEKPLHFKNILDCVVEKDINIFDYTPSDTETIQGVIERTSEYITGNRIYNFRETITLQSIFAVLGGMPDKSADGYYPEYIFIKAHPLIYNVFDSDLGEYIDTYNGHDLTMEVVYIRIRSTIQHNYMWKLIPSDTDYFFSYVPQLTVGSAEHYIQTFYEGEMSWDYFDVLESTTGKLNTYSDVPISNTYFLNEILIDIFLCTGKTLISNFFGINTDSTQPNNSFYEFATVFCQGVKICQSYDVIKENAEMDSFGISGIIETKKFLANLLFAYNMAIVYDEIEDVIRFEHITYFTRKAMNLVTAELDYELEPLKLNKDQIDSELFLFAAETRTTGFYKAQIKYNTVAAYKSENEVKRQSDLFITDVFATLNNDYYEQENYKALFFLLATEDSEIIGLNTCFSMLNLVKELHSVIRPMKSGKLNNELITFNSYSIGFTTKVKLLSGSYKIWEKVFPYYSIVLKEGTFLIDEISYNEKKEMEIVLRK